MRKQILRRLLLIVLLFAVIQPICAHAITPVDTQRNCSITLHYTKDDTVFPGLDVHIYRVAKASPDGTFDLVSPFDSYPVNIHGITTQQEWQEATSTLAAYISADQIVPHHSKKTDTTGTVVFDQLATGLYLICGTVAENEDGLYEFDDFLIYLPTPLEDGSHDYDVEAKPKCSAFTPMTEYKVIKLWKDSGYTSKRPKSITIDILKDGVLYDTQVLSAENNWTYTWRVPDGEGKWTVVERDVPRSYTVTITNKMAVFTITNTYPTPSTDIPKTGDIFPLWPYIIVMCLSGFLLLALGIWHKRNQK